MTPPSQQTVAGHGPQKWRDESGFSLIELMIAAAMAALLLGLVFDFLESVRDYSTKTSSSADARQQTRVVANRIAEDIRSAGADPSGNAFRDGVEIFPEATSTRLRLRRDLAQDVNDDDDTYDVVDLNNDGDTTDNNENENGDGVLDDAFEDVTYVFDAANASFFLIDNATGTQYTIAEGVIANADGTPTFQYDVESGQIIGVTVQITIESSIRDEVADAPAQSIARITARPRTISSRVLDSLNGD
jgi:prepilin-type N-terminal cleavage/methylation domain-containing protein